MEPERRRRCVMTWAVFIVIAILTVILLADNEDY